MTPYLAFTSVAGMLRFLLLSSYCVDCHYILFKSAVLVRCHAHGTLTVVKSKTSKERIGDRTRPLRESNVSQVSEEDV